MVAEVPNDSVAHGNRAAASMMLHEYENAAEECAAAIALDPGYTRAYERAARAWELLGELDNLVDVCRAGGRFNSALRARAEVAQQAKQSLELARRQLRSLEPESWAKAASAGNDVRERFSGCVQAVFVIVASRRRLLQLSSASALARETLPAALCGRNESPTARLRKNGQPTPAQLSLAIEWAFVLWWGAQEDEALRVLAAVRRVAAPEQGLPTTEGRVVAFDDIARLVHERISTVRAAKDGGNSAFRAENYAAARVFYNRGLALLEEGPSALEGLVGVHPMFLPRNDVLRAVFFANKAAIELAVSDWSAAVHECSRALDLNGQNVRARLRRARAERRRELWTRAVEDMETAVQHVKAAVRLARSVVDGAESVDSELLKESWRYGQWTAEELEGLLKEARELRTEADLAVKRKAEEARRQEKARARADPRAAGGGRGGAAGGGGGGGRGGSSSSSSSSRGRARSESPPPASVPFPPDYYGVLEVVMMASIDEVKKSFRRLAKQHHPDKVGPEATDVERKAAEERFKLLNEAYSVISDPVRRADHDREWKRAEAAQRARARRPPPASSSTTSSSSFFTRGARGAPWSPPASARASHWSSAAWDHFDEDDDEGE